MTFDSASDEYVSESDYGDGESRKDDEDYVEYCDAEKNFESDFRHVQSTTGRVQKHSIIPGGIDRFSRIPTTALSTQSFQVCSVLSFLMWLNVNDNLDALQMSNRKFDALHSALSTITAANARNQTNHLYMRKETMNRAVIDFCKTGNFPFAPLCMHSDGGLQLCK
uniref:Uncharacterized protein n=1 Tax=Ditylenchus dipsaci TaxID=166011 RepID=A0A915EKQ3_9BILA